MNTALYRWPHNNSFTVNKNDKINGINTRPADVWCSFSSLAPGGAKVRGLLKITRFICTINHVQTMMK